MNSSSASNPKRPRLAAAMARHSESSIHRMQQLLQGKDAKQRSGAAKRRFSEVLAPVRNCFVVLEASNIEAAKEKVKFCIADVKETMRFLCNSCPSFCACVQQAGAHGPLRVVLAHDATTAGNVLATEARQKAIFLYMTFTFLQAMHDSPHAWVPVGCICQLQCNHVQGGLSAVHRVFIDAWAAQHLDQEFLVRENVAISLQLDIIICDMEGQRAALCAKGSAGLKPCAFCVNVLAKDATASADGENFFTISEANFSLFKQHSQNSLERYMATYIPEINTMTKANRELRERCLGYNFNTDGMWASPTCCRILPLEKYCNDSMHIYFSNGICCVEIPLLIFKVQHVTNMTVGEILQAVTNAGWKRPSGLLRHGENDYWRKTLFTAAYFSEKSLYKGGAKQTLALMSLLRWLTQDVWIKHPDLHDAASCFLLLCRCCDCLRNIAQTRDFATLAVLQQQHHEAFVRTWPDKIRPKHHHRFHLSEHYIRHRFIPTLWGMEAKHKDYKSVFAANMQQWLTERNGGVDFSQRLLPRLLLRHAELLNDSPMSPHGWILENEFSQEEVERETGLTNCNLSARARIGSMNVGEGDMVLWGRETLQAGVCLFFLRDKNELFVYMDSCRLLTNTDALKVFQRTGEKAMVKWTSLNCPRTSSWWRPGQDNRLLCLP
eukprot:Skav229162  [mRNA]  locus=scaffold1381:220437:222428:- [translate_table: standard]